MGMVVRAVVLVTTTAAVVLVAEEEGYLSNGRKHVINSGIIRVACIVACAVRVA